MSVGIPFDPISMMLSSVGNDEGSVGLFKGKVLEASDVQWDEPEHSLLVCCWRDFRNCKHL